MSKVKLLSYSMREKPKSTGADWFKIVVNKKDDVTKVYIYDEIGFWGTTSKDFAAELNEIETKRRLQEEEKLARKAEKLTERNGEKAEGPNLIPTRNITLIRLEYQPRLSLCKVKQHLSKETIRPREPGARVIAPVVNVDRFVD